METRYVSSRLAAVTIAVGLLLLAPAALAQGITTAVLGVGGDTSARMRGEVGEILLNAVENNNALASIDRRDLDVREALMFLGCSDVTESCLRELAFTLEVDRVIYGEILEPHGETAVHLRYYDALNNENLLAQTFPLSEPHHRSELELQLAAVVSDQAVLRVNADRPGVAIYLDEILIGEAPVVSLDLAPGQHTLLAECDGCDFERIIELQRGRAHTETILVGRGDVAVGRRADNGQDELDDSGSSLLLPTLTIALGSALLVTGATFGFVMRSTQDDFDSTPSLTRAEELASTGDTQALLANVFLASGAAITATGIILMLVADVGDEEAPMTEVRAAPWIGPAAGGVLFEGNF